MDKLASYILQNHPLWASYALRFVPNLGNYREAIAKKALELIPTAPPESLAEPTKKIGGLELCLINGLPGDFYFTMFWLSAPNVTQPAAGNPDSGTWKWSPMLNLLINPCWSAACSFFPIPNSPLSPGETVWMVIEPACGNWTDPGYRFIYDPGAPYVRINASPSVADRAPLSAGRTEKVEFRLAS